VWGHDVFGLGETRSYEALVRDWVKFLIWSSPGSAEPPTDPGSFTSCQPALRAASSMEASMLSKLLLSIVSITGPVSRPMGPPLGTYR
jgi:hypothetical protein